MTPADLATRYEDAARRLYDARRRTRRTTSERETAELLLELHVSWRRLYEQTGRGWSKLVIEERRRRA